VGTGRNAACRAGRGPAVGRCRGLAGVPGLPRLTGLAGLTGIAGLAGARARAGRGCRGGASALLVGLRSECVAVLGAQCEAVLGGRFELLDLLGLLPGVDALLGLARLAAG